MKNKYQQERKGANKADQNRPLTVVEAGRKGGLATFAKLGRPWFIEIGAKGQQVLRSRYPGMAQEWGRKGGRPKKPCLSDLREPGK